MKILGSQEEVIIRQQKLIKTNKMLIQIKKNPVSLQLDNE